MYFWVILSLDKFGQIWGNGLTEITHSSAFADSRDHVHIQG